MPLPDKFSAGAHALTGVRSKNDVVTRTIKLYYEHLLMRVVSRFNKIKLLTNHYSAVARGGSRLKPPSPRNVR
jgi:hypothetical protein